MDEQALVEDPAELDGGSREHEPDVARIRLEPSAHHHAGTELVGGDFSEVFALGDDTWGIVSARFTTAAFMRLRGDADRGELVVDTASGGHPPALIRARDGSVMESSARASRSA